MKQGLICFMLLFTVGVLDAAQPAWVSVGTGTSIIEEPFVTSSSPDKEHYTLTVDTPGFLIRQSMTKSGPLAELVLPGQTFSGIPGQASLPVVRLLVEIPYEARATFTVTRGPAEAFTLEELGIRDVIVPVQEPIIKTADGHDNWSFSKDDTFYATDAFFPANQVSIEKIFYHRAHRLVQVAISPINYNPVRGSIVVFQQLTVEFTFSGGDVEKTRREIQRTWSAAFEDNIAVNVINYGMFEPSVGLSEEKSQHYWDGLLIISAPEYAEAAETLAQWRSRTGYYVSHVTTAQTGTTIEAIKNYLQQAYASWSDPPLTFVLLVGDVDKVPTPPGVFCGDCASDSDYACLVGDDNVPDVYLGRVSVESTTEAEKVFERLMNYATVNFTQSGWIKKATFSSSCDDLYNSFLTHEYCLENFTRPRGYTGTYYPPGTDPGGDLIRCIEDYQYDGSAAGDTVINCLNEGRSLMTYSGHCGSTVWAGPDVDVVDLISAHPGQMTPFMIGHCCSAHDIQFSSPCFGEVSMREVAIGYYGSSNSSMWGEDDYLQKAWFAKLFNGQHRLGEFTTNGMIDMYITYNSSVLDYYMDMELLGGDPTMELYTDVPLALSLVHNGVASVGQHSYELTVMRDGVPLSGARICLLKGDGGDAVRAFAVSDSSGMASLSMNPPPASAGIIDITVTAINAKPVTARVDVIPPSGPWLVWRSHVIDDATGNGNGAINPGERIVMPVTLANIGVAAGTTITAVLDTTSPYCTLSDNTATFPNMSVQGQAQSQPDHFEFVIDPLTPSGQIIEFRLAWSADGGYSGQTSWSVRVVIPILAVVENSLDDGPLGNSHLDAGETATLKVFLENQGSCAAPGVSAVLTSLSPWVTVTSNQAWWPDIQTGETVVSQAPHFTVMAHANTPLRHVVQFRLLVQTGNGFSWSSDFDMTVGLRGQVLVIDDDSNGAAALIATTLANLSYRVSIESATLTQPSSWGDNDFLVHASGHNEKPVTSLTSALRTYVQAGGRLLLEGGEVLFDVWTADPAFMSEVMHCTKWNYNKSGNLRKAVDSHPIASIPHVLPATLTHTYERIGDQDAGTHRTDATRVFTWSDYSTKAGIIASDNDAYPENGGQLVICTFDWTNLSNTDQARDHLLENIAAWLVASRPAQEVPSLSLAGLVILVMLCSMFLTSRLVIGGKKRNPRPGHSRRG